jgi:arylsulfatase A-like enzyme
VPFIVRWPGKIKPASISNDLISLSDMPATFAALTDQEVPDNSAEDSFNVLPALLGENTKQSAPVRIFHSGSGVFAIRRGKWKLIEGTKGSGSGKVDLNVETLSSVGQLYDLENDPYEKNDLWGTNSKVVNELSVLLEKFKNQGFSRTSKSNANL